MGSSPSNGQLLEGYNSYDDKRSQQTLVVLYLICVLHVKGIDDSTAVASLTDEALLGTQQTLSDVLLPNLDGLPQSVIECTTVNLY